MPRRSDCKVLSHRALKIADHRTRISRENVADVSRDMGIARGTLQRALSTWRRKHASDQN